MVEVRCDVRIFQDRENFVPVAICTFARWRRQSRSFSIFNPTAGSPDVNASPVIISPSCNKICRVSTALYASVFSQKSFSDRAPRFKARRRSRSWNFLSRNGFLEKNLHKASHSRTVLYAIDVGTPGRPPDRPTTIAREIVREIVMIEAIRFDPSEARVICELNHSAITRCFMR